MGRDGKAALAVQGASGADSTAELRLAAHSEAPKASPSESGASRLAKLSNSMQNR